MKVAELAALPPKILIYSRPGLIKTSLLLTLGEDLLLHDLDDNLDVAFGVKDQFTADRQLVEVKQFLDADPSKAYAFNKYKEALKTVAQKCKLGQFEYKYYGLDSLTSLAAACQNQIMSNSGKIEKNPEIQHWGLIVTEIERIVTWIRALSVPVFILAHEMTFTDDQDVSQVQISIPGQKLPGKITRMFSEIWYLRARPKGAGVTEVYVQSVPSSAVTCRSGRGLPTGTRVATILKDGSAKDSVGLKTLLDMIWTEDKEPKNNVKT